VRGLEGGNGRVADWRESPALSRELGVDGMPDTVFPDRIGSVYLEPPICLVAMEIHRVVVVFNDPGYEHADSDREGHQSPQRVLYHYVFLLENYVYRPSYRSSASRIPLGSSDSSEFLVFTMKAGVRL
jgi:hypothetical protein